MGEEKITVIVPFMGAPRVRHLIRTLDSLTPQMKPRDQLIVVEQCQMPGESAAHAVCANRGVTLERLALGGRMNIGACLNRGVSAGWNKVFAVCNADCIKHPLFLDRARHLFRDARDVAYIGQTLRLGQLQSQEIMELGGGHPRPLNIVEWEGVLGWAVPDDTNWQDGLVFRKAQWRNCGKFYEHFDGIGPVGEDFVWRLRLHARMMRNNDLKSVHLWHKVLERNERDLEANRAIMQDRKKGNFFTRVIGTRNKVLTEKISDLAGVD